MGVIDNHTARRQQDLHDHMDFLFGTYKAFAGSFTFGNEEKVKSAAEETKKQQEPEVIIRHAPPKQETQIERMLRRKLAENELVEDAVIENQP